ncbi:cytochrome P450 [Guyanagaster necrorhizus]|uniref:Cytochrome P450 n=1 Tax=Guyanagaster necrorhizus TaxID=856835 RepID=A0A9P8AKJ7_9AGAR|nr:cytochrome P450 [Guyanagaster necrorhizus MCA 3950]KAG7439293.1 cytochrome P450 [Guyanagaster necrorhizus MCA 3950]
MTWLLLLISCVLTAGLLLSRRFQSRSLPPGPPGHWLFGNDLPRKRAFLKYEEWTREYGPVFSLKRFGKVYIVVGRYDAAVEIMEKCGMQTSDRPRAIAASETFSGGLRPILLSDTPRWRALNRALHSHLKTNKAMAYEPIQFYHAKKLILNVLDDPERFTPHTKIYAASVILTLTYGKTTPTTFDDPDLQQMLRDAERFRRAILPGAYLVDTFPVLRWVPGYLAELKRWHRDSQALCRRCLGGVQERMASGAEVLGCFAKDLLDKKKLSFDQAAFLAGSMFAAGSNTTASAMVFVIMAAACFPDAAKVVQKEIDELVGQDRCPTFEDRERLPQVMAFVSECFRWRPLFPSGIAHAASEDIVWHDYMIPKGATIIASPWSIFHSTDVFPNPEDFDPQRWIVDGKVREDIRQFVYGFGRRVCPGSRVANRSLFINAALLLWAFDILPTERIDTMAFADEPGMHPGSFGVRFDLRVGREREDWVRSLMAK